MFWASMHIRDEKKEYFVESRRIKEIVAVFRLQCTFVMFSENVADNASQIKKFLVVLLASGFVCQRATK
jgi:hypothetical protein